ncbi:ribosomal RNA small subunit methyltransferase, chloroplastic isoform X2 [Capsicum annuum]|uniref:ribosomal RNA small subunit methyltransferase, chloroplastic isoform X2 n=1 Tax=Capsicum annuum TaxID=4072 RepID=UPI0007BEAFF9|nr:ribosomal RNA small subunit methyltransferase, chloroplastic isoform X2 [Capsicum annuum]
MPCLLHSLLPLSSTPKPLLLANSSVTSGPFAADSQRLLSFHTVTAVSKTKSETRINKKAEDDYHATLKALNSKGRFPRKSLGQDPYMAALVTERFSSLDGVKVLQEDFTKCHIRSHLSTVSQSGRNSSGVKPQYAKVVSNLPFNISTEVIKQLLPMGDIFSEVILLLQEEAAVRMVDSSLRSSEYRPINIFINFYSEPEYKFKVPRTNFFPQPKVDAAVVSFRLKQPVDYPPVSSAKSFFSMVNCAFNGKRKMLRKTLQHICSPPEIEEALVSAGLPSTSRPEELALDDFVRLHNSIIVKA